MTCVHRYRITTIWKETQITRPTPSTWSRMDRTSWIALRCPPIPSTRSSRKEMRPGLLANRQSTICLSILRIQQPTKSIGGGLSMLVGSRDNHSSKLGFFSHLRDMASWEGLLAAPNSMKVWPRVTWASWTVLQTRRSILPNQTTQEYLRQWIEKTSLAFSRKRTCSCRQRLGRAKQVSSLHSSCRQIKLNLTKKTFKRGLRRRTLSSARPSIL